MRSKRVFSLLGAGLVSFSAASLDAAPKLRVQVDQRGDFVLIGNTLAHDCGSGVNPVVGTVGSCGSNTSDSGADVYWQADWPNAGQARANTSVSNADARSTAVLSIPDGATVTHAYLYWAAAISAFNSPADTEATLRAPNGATLDVDAIESYKAQTTGTQANQWAYHSVANVTDFVKTHGSGAYRVSGVNSVNLTNQNSHTLFAGWWMVVFYTLPTDPPRNLALFDGLDAVSQNSSQTVTISGFLVPNGGFDGKLGVIAFEGDEGYTGDSLKFRGYTLSNALNPENNFFNGTRSHFGSAVSVAGDLPRLTGGQGSMSGIDIDVVDVKSYLAPGLTSAQIQASTSTDVFFLGGFVTSIATFRPDFITSTKTATDVNGAPLIVGDTLKYTITVTNTGNDTSVNTVVTDPLPAGVTYVPGSLQIESGPNAGAKTDAADDDQAEYDPATRTVRFRVGNGANASQGGTLAVNDTTVVSFVVTVNEAGTISNQATITAAGQLGAPASSTPTGHTSPGEPTDSDAEECTSDADCPDGKVCDTSGTSNACVECFDDSHCSGTTLTCDTATNTCVCVPTNGGVEICDGVDNDCDGQIDEDFNVGEACTSGLGICERPGVIVCGGMGTAVCDAVPGQPQTEICGDNLDSDCDGDLNNGCECLSDSDCEVGELCDTGVGASYTCIPGCRGVGGNGCASGSVCTSTDASVGQCVQCTADSHCGGATSGKVCNLATNTCVDGCRGTGGNGCATDSVCTSTDATFGQCVQCTADSHCGGVTSGKVCNLATNTCTSGCRGDGFGNGCGAGTVCTSTDSTIGTCVQCTTDAHCGGPTSAKVCDLVTKTCTDGCRGDGFGNGCDEDAVCTSTDATVGTCVECTEDSHCGDVDSGKVCDTTKNECQDGCRGTGGNGCASDEHCTSSDDTIGTCVECLVDSHCGAVDSGTVCDEATNTCTAGCRGEGFGNGCYGDNVVCTSTDATIGNCVGCVTDDDCGTATSGKVCDTTTETCVDGCRGADGNGCEPGEVCTSTDATIGTCVECVIDSDCGGATSGRVCDTSSNMCVDGCRGENGNGCEPGEVCSSTDESIGTCQEPSDGDAGTGDGDAGAGDDDAGTELDADEDDGLWATGAGVLCSAQSGAAGGAAGWLFGGAVAALALVRRRRR